MKLFGWLSDNKPGQVVGVGKLEKMVKADRATFRQATADAILALGDQPFSEENFSFLYGKSSTGPYCDIALRALGMIGHPRTIELLIREVRYPGASYERWVKAYRNPRNQLAVEPLLEIALTSGNYIAVESALRALGAIGGTQAQEAIGRFRAAPSRIVTVLWAGFETPEPVSTTFLGQRPSERELSLVHGKLTRENIFSFGSDEEALAALERCLDTPESAPLPQLEAFLAKGITPPRGEIGVRGPGITRSAGSPDLPRQAVDEWIAGSRLNFDQRDQAIRGRLALADKRRLEAHILNRLEADRSRALDFYLLLPERSELATLQGLAHPFQGEDEIPAYLAQLRQRDLARIRHDIELQVDEARARPDDPEARLAAFLAAYQNESEFGLSLLAELVEPLLADQRWAVRKRTIETLAKTQTEIVSRVLERHAASETDFELQTYARQTAQLISQPATP
jgi:hypothetical protein